MAAKQKEPGAGVQSDKTIHQDVQEQDAAALQALLDSCLNKTVETQQINGRVITGILIEANSKYIKLQQGTANPRYIVLFTPGLSSLFVVEKGV